MAIALVQKKMAYNASAAVSAVFDSNPTAGNLMVAVGYGRSAYTNASIAGWTLATWANRAADGTKSGAIFYRVVQVGDSATVTLNWMSSTSTFINITEWSGIASAVLDKTAKADTTGSSVTSQTSGTTATTIAASELCIAGFCMADITSSQSLTNSFVLEQNNSGMCSTGYLIATSAATYETTLSWTTSVLACGMIATFKGVSAATWTPKVIMVM